jgi:hypothetical protein
MRLHRLRKSKGLRCLTLELRDSEVDAMVRRGLIGDAQRNDFGAIRRAIYNMLEHNLLAGLC